VTGAGSTEPAKSTGAGADSDPRVALVGAGYDAMIDTWEAWSAQIADDPRHACELLPGVVARCRTWLADGGYLMAVFGTSDLEGWTGDFLGAPSFFSSYTPDVNLRLVAEAGFTVEREEVVEIVEPEGPVRFQWILARR
jgi:hypothetical protein